MTLTAETCQLQEKQLLNLIVVIDVVRSSLVGNGGESLHARQKRQKHRAERVKSEWADKPDGDQSTI